MKDLERDAQVMRDDAYYMKKALMRAQLSYKHGEVPVGAVIVDSQTGTIIARGHNQAEARDSQLFHAEMVALRVAARKKGWRLDQCILYVTLEPCMMCLGAILLSRVKKIVYGAPSPLFGVTKNIQEMPRAYNVHTTICGGLQRQECGDILSAFFTEKRKKKG